MECICGEKYSVFTEKMGSPPSSKSQHPEICDKFIKAQSELFEVQYTGKFKTIPVPA